MLNATRLWSASSLLTVGPYDAKKSSEQQNIKRSVSKNGSESEKSDSSHFRPTVHEKIHLCVNMHHADIWVTRTGFGKLAKCQSGDCVVPVMNKTNKNSQPVKQN